MNNKANFKKAIHLVLSEAGFRNKGQSSYFDGPDAVVVLNIQKSDFDSKNYINFGVWLKSFGLNDFPLENKCHIQVRLTAIFPLDAETIERGCQLEGEFEASFALFLNLMRTKVIPFCVDCSANDTLRVKFQNGDFKKGLVMKDAKDFLLK
jgi:hypothetical protein